MDNNLVKNLDYTDFPFKNSTNKQWLFSIIILLVGFSITFFSGIIKNMILNLGIFMVCCYFSLYVLDNKFFRKVFRKLKFSDVFKIFGTLFFTYAFVILILSNFTMPTSQNPIVDIVNKSNWYIFFSFSIIQLLGEEILFVVPFLFVFNKLKEVSENRNMAIFVALIISSVFFGMLHLPTYSFNFMQSIVLIGGVRFALSLGYVWTKNLTVTYIVHVLYDWIIIFLIVFTL